MRNIPSNNVPSYFQLEQDYLDVKQMNRNQIEMFIWLRSIRFLNGFHLGKNI